MIKIKKLIQSVVTWYGPCYSKRLGIELEKKNEIFKWFLASILFGAPINEKSAIKTYFCFKKYKVLSPEKIIETGWNGLVKILDEGSYTRYDFKTADKLLEVMKNLVKNYDSDINKIRESASNTEDLKNKIKALGKGIGDITINIFLRELRYVWKIRDLELSKFTIISGKNLGIIKEGSFDEIEEVWKKNRLPGYDAIDLETSLLKIGKDLCRKGKCNLCKVIDFCRWRK
ncbi:MAG: hypothetical protein OH319_04025 [Candidatus Parvarchaeota archaeon]|nr:hypothetical protein [Candidatus Jingweiarchaeum tengchongense]MCW1298046.1 hypothetical protein [Candidatus Jingweiarchaeum tengchongense]MCW1300154.1 hypothetical protein [Candidatus Jingweiarchaeum tengchongense]MCW1304364.1 hypothetical protein [Candidatus Jingweiarchaeum tengchongense]MCW1305916.1 hypothetical protein [Candidatus Jingweiarchaeum tengchongense]